MSTPTETPNFDTLVTADEIEQHLEGVQFPLPEVAQMTKKMHWQHNQLLRSARERQRIGAECGEQAENLPEQPGMKEAEAQVTSELFIERLATLTRTPLSVPTICRLCRISEHGFFTELTQHIDDPERVREIARQVIMALVAVPMMMLAQETVEQKMGGRIVAQQKVGLMTSVTSRAIDYLIKLYPKKFEEMNDDEFRKWALNALVIDPSVWEQLDKYFTGDDQERSFDPRKQRFAATRKAIMQKVTPAIDDAAVREQVPPGGAVPQELVAVLVVNMFAKGFEENTEVANRLVLGFVADVLEEQEGAPLRQVIARVAERVAEQCAQCAQIMETVVDLEEQGVDDHLDQIEEALDQHPASYMDATALTRIAPPRIVKGLLGHIVRFARANAEGALVGLLASHSEHEKLTLHLTAGGFKKVEMICQKALRGLAGS